MTAHLADFPSNTMILPILGKHGKESQRLCFGCELHRCSPADETSSSWLIYHFNITVSVNEATGLQNTKTQLQMGLVSGQKCRLSYSPSLAFITI